MKTSSFVLSSVLLLLSLPAIEATAQSGNQGATTPRGQLRSSSQRPPVVNNQRGNRRAPVAAPRQPRPNQPRRNQRSRNDSYRRLVSPMGSATNVSPGFYRQFDAPKHGGYQHGPVIYPGPVVLPQPQVIYIRDETQAAPEPQYQEPRYQEPRYQETAPAPKARVEIAQPVPVYVVEPPRQARQPPAPAKPAVARSTTPQEVDLRIKPADAEVFLDDEYLGTAQEILASGLLSLIPGVYVLEVDHPDYRPQRLVFGVAGDEPMSVAIDLTAERAGRRARVK